MENERKLAKRVQPKKASPEGFESLMICTVPSSLDGDLRESVRGGGGENFCNIIMVYQLLKTSKVRAVVRALLSLSRRRTTAKVCYNINNAALFNTYFRAPHVGHNSSQRERTRRAHFCLWSLPTSSLVRRVSILSSKFLRGEKHDREGEVEYTFEVSLSGFSLNWLPARKRLTVSENEWVFKDWVGGLERGLTGERC